MDRPPIRTGGIRARRNDGSQPPLAGELTRALLHALERDRLRRPENGAATATRRLTVRDPLQLALELERGIALDAQERAASSTRPGANVAPHEQTGRPCASRLATVAYTYALQSHSSRWTPGDASRAGVTCLNGTVTV
jgi:hypothetical protein